MMMMMMSKTTTQTKQVRKLKPYCEDNTKHSLFSKPHYRALEASNWAVDTLVTEETVYVQGFVCV